MTYDTKNKLIESEVDLEYCKKNIIDINAANIDKKPLKFVHITKCAGTSIEDAGKNNNIEWGRFHKEYGFWHKCFIYIDVKIIEKYVWFVVVRNPYDRIVSEYFCNWSGIGRRTEKCNLTKDEINKYLIGRINSRNPTGDHYTEQYKYINPRAKMYVLKFENLEAEFNNLMTKYSLEHIKLEKKNAKKPNISNFFVSDFSIELIKLINNVYDIDFKLFGYKKIEP